MPHRYPTLLPKTAALLYLCHFNCLVAGDCDDSLGMLAGLAAEGVPPHLLHRLALQMAGFGSASPGSKYAAQVAASAARSSRPAASPAQVRCTIAELREACGGSWSDAVSGFIAGWSAAELKVRAHHTAGAVPLGQFRMRDPECCMCALQSIAVISHAPQAALWC